MKFSGNHLHLGQTNLNLWSPPTNYHFWIGWSHPILLLCMMNTYFEIANYVYQKVLFKQIIQELHLGGLGGYFRQDKTCHDDCMLLGQRWNQMLNDQWSHVEFVSWKKVILNALTYTPFHFLFSQWIHLGIDFVLGLPKPVSVWFYPCD